METVKVKKTSGNGKGKKDDAIVKSSPNFKPIEKKPNNVKKEEVKPTVEKKVEKPIEQVQEPVLSLDQKIEKVENLKTLIDKRELLEESRKKLNSFVVGTNQFNESIVLTDENGNKFQTSNSEVFTKVVKSINETLIEKISEIENQIKF